MRIPRLYLPEAFSDGAQCELSAEASHYLCRVLRLTAGRELVVFDGEDRQANAVVEHADPRQCTIRLTGVRTESRESPLCTRLIIGVSKGERMDWVLQKSTELGVSELLPVWTERTEVNLRGPRLEKRLAHWRKTLESACEQCQRNRLPGLAPPIPLAALLPADDPGLGLLLDPRGARHLRDCPPPERGRVTLLIGPEGGLSEDELDLAEAHGFISVVFGPRILRTETAPLAALCAVQTLWGDFR